MLVNMQASKALRVYIAIGIGSADIFLHVSVYRSIGTKPKSVVH